MIEFKNKATNIITNIVLVAAFIIALFSLKGEYDNLFYLVLIFVLGYVFNLIFSKKRVVRIVVFEDLKSIDIYFRKYTFKKSKESYLIKDLDIEHTNKRNIRGVNKEQLEIKKIGSDISILLMIADFDGWSEKKLKEIHDTIVRLK
ncbi:hypothetical protein H0I31_02135 [Tenacibaculum sp. AHE15PA]|uniref:hypothetical protein n=1 Tax=unclassified Tenacibaculum TaxID=2635139 RepID=UPI001C4F3E74|nr:MULTISPECIES: hypothetical protein [unclassified Tenacibaculum]QXP72521.1 hypothetical protein H0I30_07390 [Tenacibaculum sp. AHE14PA]QXP76436.1 hypothetical protein H0I31_02135 [Tenacibaculum sp. AHE15PA]